MEYQPIPHLTESASDLYAELHEAYSRLPDCREAYRRLNGTFQRLLNAKTDLPGVRFSGPFAKTDYLLKEYHALGRLERSVHDARVRLRDYGRRADAELASEFPYDFQAISQFVALVFQVPVPAGLETLFPARREQRRGGVLRSEYLRIIVRRWDDTYIFAHADREDAEAVTVCYGVKAGVKAGAPVFRDWDWSYLRPLLKEGLQLNIVRPREQDGVLYPELFIYEPDYLVDISAVAGCFESYAASPFNHLLSRIKPSPPTQPIILGNLASQFLDEALSPPVDSYAQSVQRFFRANALSLLTTPLAPDFHRQAQAQRQNISTMLEHTLPGMLTADGLRFHASEVMVEPSFFSEMLGLQGRMDFLHLSHQVIIEQKSGKARYPETDPPKEQDRHLVQLLLYIALLDYNYRDVSHGRQRIGLHPYLLYSRYRNGLIRVGAVPRLLFEALRLRNELVAAEFSCTSGGWQMLCSLSADALNQNHVQGPLWERYQKPQIDALLAPLHNASALERAYYLRMMQFLSTEHLMAKVGSQTKENAGFADKWYASLDEKLAAGNIYCDLSLLSPDASATGRVERVVLGFTERPDHEISNFRAGDIVVLYPYAEGSEPDVRRSMVFRGTIEEIGADQLVLNLRSAQVDGRVFWYHGPRRWAIEHDFFESSFAPLYRGMHAFLSAPRERRDLLLLQREPQTDERLRLLGDYGAFNELALRVRQARDLFLIIGPPGTGKTSYGLMNTLREELLTPDGSVLLLSFTNRAVDEICSKLLSAGIDFIRIGSRFSCEEAFRPYLLDARVEQCGGIDDLRDAVLRTRVFVGTTAAFNGCLHLFRLKQFSLAVIDEASQILEPHLAGLLSATDDRGASAIRKIVMIGDHKQLPAVVLQNAGESAVSDPLLQDACLTDCRLSLFERLLRRYRDDPRVTYMLTRQGRMHHDIARFPNVAFYQNRLDEVPLAHQREGLPAEGRGCHGIDDLLLTRRVAFVAVDEGGDSLSGKVNVGEARAIAATVVRIYQLCQDHFDPLQTVGVIVPYRNQIAEVRSQLERYAVAPLRHITIDTVERFQGSQRDYILYGFTIRHAYQLSFLTGHVFREDGSIIDRKLNVAMTRARRHLLLFGRPDLLARSEVFRRLIAFVGDCGGYVSVSLDDYVSGRFTVPPLPHLS